jgi:predicted permease
MDVAGDIRYALRQLIKTPSFTLTALVTLALGIGVNVAMFSVIDQALLRNSRYYAPDRIVQMGPRPWSSDGFAVASLPDVQDWRARTHSFSGIAYYTFQLPTLGGTANPQLVAQITSSANLFDLLGIHAAMGRTFTAEDEQPGKTNVLVLSNSIWKEFFHSDPHIIGRAVPVNGIDYTVIGVLPPGIDFPEGSNAMTSPLQANDKDFSARDSSSLTVIGRLRPGVSVAQAQHELEQIHQQLQKEYPGTESTDPLRVELYQDVLTENARPALFALGGAVLAVWSIACANVAGLMLTRVNSRRREIAIRGALGAGRPRLIKQFLTESLLLGLGGGALGLGISALALRLLSHFLEGAVRHGSDIHINVAVCAYLLLASCISAVFFGVVPAWHAAQVPPQEGLREGTAAAGTSRRQALWRDSLVVGEIALTLTLLIAGGLMMRTLWELRHTRLGFEPQNLVTISMFLPTHGQWWTTTNTNQPDLLHTFYQPLLAKLAATPGIESAGLSSVRPMDTNAHFNMSIEIAGLPKPPKGQEPRAQVRASSPDYFKTIGTPLLRGRFFTDSDRAGSQRVAIINEAFVRRVFPNMDPLGKQIVLDDEKKGETATIVGVVPDARQNSVGDTPEPEVHFALNQLVPGTLLYAVLAGFHMDLAARTRLAPSAALDTIAKEIHSLQPEMALQNSQSMQQVIDDSLANQTLAVRLLGIFGFAALMIAVAGIYGLLSYSVSQRTRELAVRLALGAQRGDVLWLVLRHACVLLAFGVGIGVALAWAGGGVMRSFLYGLHAYDAVTMLAVVLLLSLCGLAASFLPARRAASTNPVEALRTE